MAIRFWNHLAANDGNRSAFLKRGEEDPLFLEQFKALRAKFEYRVDMHNWKTVAVTSAIAGEGKTVTCVHLARNLASSGRKKVLLVDIDLRKSDLASALELDPVPGLSEFLAGSVEFKEVVHNSSIPGLRVVPAGSRVSAPADLISGSKFRSLLKQLRDHFDVILLDTPPVVPVADTINLRDQVDGFLLIYRAGFTPHPVFRQAVEELGESKVLGVILNGVEPKTERYYQKYYGKYYRKSGDPVSTG
ncbi:MAG: protein tyrosine kinase EpsB [Deltaproteobacteria bacterium]